MMQADKEKVSALLKTARGQIDGILKMIEQDRYCLDIYHQITATQCVLKKANKEIMTAHMYHCVKEAFEHGDPEEKIQELIDLMEKSSRRRRSLSLEQAGKLCHSLQKSGFIVYRAVFP